MKKDSRQKLMEMMEKVNPGSVNPTPTEKEIINDILSLDEGVSDIISKMKEYARKGLLTATIILTVASAVAAGNIGDDINANDVVKAGAEMVDDEYEKKIYAFYVAISRDMVDNIAVNDPEMAKDLQGVIRYYALLWTGNNPDPLTANQRKAARAMLEKAKDLNKETIENYMDKGQKFLRQQYRTAQK